MSCCLSRDEDADPVKVTEISDIYLNPDKWRKGFGKMLCDTAIDKLRKSGYTEVTLWVLEGNQQARLFYEKMRFISRSEIKADQRDGYMLREIRYRKILQVDIRRIV